MTVGEARYLLDLLGPTLEQSSHYCCVLTGGRLAVVILDEPGNVSRSELALALRVHAALPGCGLLFVL